MRYQTLCTLLALTISSPALTPAAWADAMHYTTLGARSGQLQPPELTVKHLRMGQASQDKAAAEQAQSGEKKTFEDVWQRYRALAEGRSYEGSETTAQNASSGMVPTEQRENKPYTAQRLSIGRPAVVEPQTPRRPVAPAPASLAAQEPAAGTSGEDSPSYRETPLPDHVTARPMGILDQYEQSKARRSQMKTLRINPPDMKGYAMSSQPAPPVSGDVPPLAPPDMEVHHLKMHPPQIKAEE